MPFATGLSSHVVTVALSSHVVTVPVSVTVKTFHRSAAVSLFVLLSPVELTFTSCFPSQLLHACHTIITHKDVTLII